jgi:hypothetical protein
MHGSTIVATHSWRYVQFLLYGIAKKIIAAKNSTARVIPGFKFVPLNNIENSAKFLDLNQQKSNCFR